MAQTRLLTTSDAALALNVGEDFVLSLIQSGALAAVKSDGDWLVDEAALAAFKSERDAHRRDGLRELTRMTEEIGGYDRERSNTPDGRMLR
jgi:excisionase family DNA binding protein